MCSSQKIFNNTLIFYTGVVAGVGDKGGCGGGVATAGAAEVWFETMTAMTMTTMINTTDKQTTRISFFWNKNNQIKQNKNK